MLRRWYRKSSFTSSSAQLRNSIIYIRKWWFDIKKYWLQSSIRLGWRKPKLPGHWFSGCSNGPIKRWLYPSGRCVDWQEAVGKWQLSFRWQYNTYQVRRNSRRSPERGSWVRCHSARWLSTNLGYSSIDWLRNRSWRNCGGISRRW